jgi:signal peptidase I
LVQSETDPHDKGRKGDSDSDQSDTNTTTTQASQSINSSDSIERCQHLDIDTTSESSDPFTGSEHIAREKTARRKAHLSMLGEEIVVWIKTFASAAVYATLIVTFGIQVARVEGKSMEPTLQDQDRLIINKAVYRFFEDPKPGDIVMLFYPKDPDKSFVKRVIAEEGDTVRIDEGKVYVNELFQPDIYVPSNYRSYDNHGPELVQESYYFVMGDHRNNSSDSRHWGQVPKKYILGKVQLRWWPLTDARIF